MGLLRVVDGGRAHLRLRILVVDVDARVMPIRRGGQTASAQMALSAAEARALSSAQAVGLDLVVVTSVEEQRARYSLDSMGLSVLAVISDTSTGAGASTCSRKRLNRLAETTCQHDCSLREVAVIATDSADCPMMLEAGVGFALKDAGRDAIRAADRVFPFRRAGGLTAAVEEVVLLARASYAVASTSERSWLTGR